MAAANNSRGPALNYTLWIAQVLLAALFLFAGVMKFVMPVAEMTKQSSLPGWFFWFIGVCEILGALGLILPSLLRIKPGLTPLAAAGLAIIMIGATVISASGGVKAALFPFIALLLSAFVAYGRWRLWPIAPKD
jgi:uncharacterized membrane protein YphA (DoxX/SURF4 family)